ncbi:hypothetical protein Godav_004600 [Gossypium davidsonii]|uniref:Uncharacterized protein n=2 Tax=Gossypium TaxID=3633 RepID=A0A7J8SLS6_GOSDV|nr:hypothetical protein [Gossypium davidsonii]MBA0662682.1 hypothetical protein [Gossypium klotzschianum]
MNGGENTSNGTTLPNMNTSNGDNTPSNCISSKNTNIFNLYTTIYRVFLVVDRVYIDVAINSAVTTPEATSLGYFTKEKLKRLLEDRNKSLSFSTFDIKLPNPTSIAAKTYPKNYESHEFKKVNGKIKDACEHVMKFVKTFEVVRLYEYLNLKEFSKSLIEKAYTWHVNLTS